MNDASSRRGILRHGTGLGALLLALIALGWWVWRGRALEVQTGGVEVGTWEAVLEDDGILRVQERYLVTAPVAGRWLRPALRPGDRVRRGQTLGAIVGAASPPLDVRSRREAQQRREAAEARHARALVLQAQAATALAQARADESRVASLAAQGFVAASERDQAQLALQAARRGEQAAGLEVDAALHDLRQARAAAADAVSDEAATPSRWPVNAPADGQVLRVHHESGGAVIPATPLLEIGDTGRLEAVIDVLSTEALRLTPGMPVRLTVADGVVLPGRIARIDPAARTRVSALGIEEQRVDVIVRPDAGVATETWARPVGGDGYHVEAAFIIATRTAVPRVPTAALLRLAGGWAVYRVEDGRVRLRPVEVQDRGPDWSVVEAGLAPGDRVVLYPGEALAEGQRVTPLG
ncbi:MAG: hypothetical protein RL026_1922 [Pseudomonadota bacterium]